MKFGSALHYKSALPILSIFVLALMISMPASANPDDWGMVRQFNIKSELANQGDIQAMYDIGRYYERGRGVYRDITLAAEWFQKAASAGHDSAKARLGILYYEGRGVKLNFKKALTLLESAAKSNVPSAQYQLAIMHELGTGITKNLNKAIAWYKKSDQYGYYPAKAKLSELQKLLNKGTTKRKAIAKAKKPNYPLIQTILRGRWLDQKSAVAYLPSDISNCAKDSNKSMLCTSSSQERSTGSEVITYNTESIITASNKTTFNITYTNNVLDVAQIAVENSDGEIIEQLPSRIKKGKQAKKRTLKCTLKNKNAIECQKGNSTFNLVSK